MSVLVVGRYGQVARALVRAANERSLDLVSVGRAEVDLEDVHTIASAVERLRPTLVINAGAYTAVDKAEDDADRAFRVNAFGPEAGAGRQTNWRTDYASFHGLRVRRRQRQTVY